MKRMLVSLAVASACLAAASTAGAAHTGRLCQLFKSNGTTYRSETVGTRWTCASAKAWIVKLSRDRVGHVTRNVPLTNGPRGYHCFATPFSRGGRATGGACITGTLAFPKSGFSWYSP